VGKAVKKKRADLGKMLRRKKEDDRRPFPRVQARGVNRRGSGSVHGS
jgi:hypothetical protein